MKSSAPTRSDLRSFVTAGAAAGPAFHSNRSPRPPRSIGRDYGPPVISRPIPEASMCRLSMIGLALMFVPCLFVAGCGSDGFSLAPVSGRVTVDGEPILGLRISFEPIGGPGRPAPGPDSIAITDADGKYTLYTVRRQPARGGRRAVPGAHLGTSRKRTRPGDFGRSRSQLRPDRRDQGHQRPDATQQKKVQRADRPYPTTVQ